MTTDHPAPTDRHRPDAHLTAPATWMNDPNGLILHRGIWHAFYQSNPFGPDWGHMSWGHASSPDLLTWEHHPVAIREGNEVSIFSGSVVHDRGNSSELGTAAAPTSDGPLVAVYTGAASPDHPEKPDIQAQCLAVSLDDGETWTKYHANPVLDRGSQSFRDPQVFRHALTSRWVMLAMEAEDRELLVHASRNLREWELVSSVRDDRLTGVWECPDLVHLTAPSGEDVWLLIVSTNPGGPAGGSGTWGLLGGFDGRTFTSAGGDWFPLDHGTDFYAAVTFAGVDEDPVLMGWASNWEYAARTPTSPWRGAMSLPRRLRLEPTTDGGPAGERVGDAAELHAAGALRVTHRPVLPAEPRRVDLSTAADGREHGSAAEEGIGAGVQLGAGPHVVRLETPPEGSSIELRAGDRALLTIARRERHVVMERTDIEVPVEPDDDGEGPVDPDSGSTGTPRHTGYTAPLFGLEFLRTLPIPAPAGSDLVLMLDGCIAELVVVAPGERDVAGDMATMLVFPEQSAPPAEQWALVLAP